MAVRAETLLRMWLDQLPDDHPSRPFIEAKADEIAAQIALEAAGQEFFSLEKFYWETIILESDEELDLKDHRIPNSTRSLLESAGVKTHTGPQKQEIRIGRAKGFELGFDEKGFESGEFLERVIKAGGRGFTAEEALASALLADIWPTKQDIQFIFAMEPIEDAILGISPYPEDCLFPRDAITEWLPGTEFLFILSPKEEQAMPQAA